MPIKIKAILAASAALGLGVGLALALPALAQQATEQPPAAVALAPGPVANTSAPAADVTGADSNAGDESAVEVVSATALRPPPPPSEYPGWARRNPWTVGVLDPAAHGLGANPWGDSSGAFLSTLMRRMNPPLASRWAHIALRDALLATVRAPRDVNPVDWVAERSWLLLRLGEADAARMLVASVDSDRFTPKMVQVAVQSALATADPPALCAIEGGIRKYDPNVRALVSAMCSSLAGEPESASAQIDDARRFGRVGGIDLTLAEKVVGAGANTGRAVTVEWDPVDTLTAWRFGLATATGMVPPARLIKAASPQLRAFQARAPLLTPQQRVDSAFVAAGLGVLSSQSMVDLYSAIYDSTDASDLPDSDAWQLRQAFVGKDVDARIAAIRKLLAVGGKDSLRREGARALAARAATLIEPDKAVQKDAPDLIAAMLAGGYDRAAERWASAVARMDDEYADKCWAMLALASPDAANAGISGGRLSAFIRRDTSADHVRSALLVGGLVGLGRISTDSANSLNRRFGFGLGRSTSWTRIIDAAAKRGQAGTVLVLTGSGFQTADVAQLPAVHLYHAIAGLSRTGQDFTARMIAAEALSRT